MVNLKFIILKTSQLTRKKTSEQLFLLSMLKVSIDHVDVSNAINVHVKHGSVCKHQKYLDLTPVD